jgi:hypothetical protein
MASSTEKPTVPESQNEPAMRTEVRAATSKSACEHFREYGRERPGIVALWCFGLGFVLGWKLKLW